MNRRIEDLFVPHLSKAKPYEPARPLQELSQRAGLPVNQIIRLNANENPYGPSPKVAEALTKLETHIYPDPLQRTVRGRIAEYVGVDFSMVVAGSGSDELIDMILRLFISPGDKIIECVPTFGMYSFYGKIVGAKVVSVPRDDTFEVDVGAVKSVVDRRTKMLFLNSPNNPTGNIISENQVIDLLEMDLVVVVDEAYYEFARKTVSNLVPEYKNLVVLRTFSKWAGIAGLRAGYGIMSPTIANHIIDIKSPFNINTAAEVAMIASLDDVDALLANVQLIIDERSRLFSALCDMDGVHPSQSWGNYILCEFHSGLSDAVFEGLASRGIFIRKYSNPLLKEHLRITVGTPDQNSAVITAISQLV